MPEKLPPEPSLKPLLDAKRRKRKKLPPQVNEGSTSIDNSSQDTLMG